MKKLVAVLTAAMLMAVLVFPGVAFAANNKVKTTPPGQAKKEATAEPGSKAKKDKGVDALADDGAVESDEASGAVKEKKNKNRIQVQASEEGSETVEPKLTGIANALSRIQTNIERAEAKMLDGTRKALPQGLLSVYDKFMSWLGITPEDDAPDGDTPLEEGMEDPDDPDAGEPGDPADPGDGSIEETPTPEPTGEITE